MKIFHTPSLISSLLIVMTCFLLSPQISRAEVALSDTDIRHFIATIAPLDKLGKKYDLNQNKEVASQTDNSGEFNPMSQSLIRIRSHEAYGEFKEIIKAAGFSSEQAWANVGDRVMKSFMALSMKNEETKGSGEEGLKQMQESLKQVESNQHISTELKQQLSQQINQSIKMMKNISTYSPADQNAVRPHMKDLKIQFKDVE